MALNLDKHSEARSRIKNWKMSSKGLDFAVICGNVAGEFIGGERRTKSIKATGGMTIDEVNEMLDKMCMGNDKEAKAKEFRKFIMRATEKEVVWIVSIILKDLKLGGVSEKDFLTHYHSQAYEAYTCKADLRKACDALSDRNAVLKKHDIECGEGLILAQLAGRQNTPKEVAKWTRSKAFAMETKFDGERVQIHRNKESLGEKCQYWTRNMNDFGPRGYGVMDVLFCDASEEEEEENTTVMDHNTTKESRGLPHKCILDGEILVYNKRIKEFVPFGTIKSAFNAANWKKGTGKSMPIVPKGFYENPTMQTKEKNQARDEEEEDKDDIEEDKEDIDYAAIDNDEEEGITRYEWKDFEIVYIPFDILFDQDTSVIHEPLRKRYKLLKGAIRGCLDKGAVKVGDTGITCAVISPFQDDIAGNESQASVARKFRTIVEQNDPNAIAKISDCLREAQDHGEEGIVVKLLDSPWVPGERGSNWVKLKPDYCETSDYDCVIIGGYYGEGRGRAGKISQWLLGIIKDGTQQDKHPVITTFCKVGTGFNRQDQEYLRDKLKDVMRPNRKNIDKNYTKHYERYECTGMPGETPDVWITNPEKSVVMTVKGDVRLVASYTFNSPYSLRFPRCAAIRPEKPCNDICTDQDIRDKVENDVKKLAQKGRGGDSGDEQGNDEQAVYKEYDRKNAKGLKRKQKRSLAVQEKYVAHMQPVDVRDVVPISKIFEGTNFSSIGCDHNVKKEIAKFVVSRGGKFFESVVASVNRVVAPPTIEDDDAYLQACDEVLSTSWLFSCADQEIWPPKARDWIKVSPSVATLYDKTIDAFGDAHASEDLNDEDLRAMMHQVRSRKRRGTEFKLLKHIDDDDRQKLRKILRLSSDDDVAKKADATEENVKVKEARERHHFASAIALELIERRKDAAAEMLRMY